LYGIIPLTNGNYVIASPAWNGNRGAVTWGNGSTGIIGVVSATNSVIGSNSSDLVGLNGVTPLRNGNYVVVSYAWSGNRGAVTWGNGSTGTSGTVSNANSLVGGNPNDYVGSGGGALLDSSGHSFGGGVIPLSNSNYVVDSPHWEGFAGYLGRGAVTLGNGTTGVSGTVSADNSLVGDSTADQIGNFPGVIALSNGNYVIGSLNWNNDRGAVTWADGGLGITGSISAATSLIGTSPGDRVGFFIPLENGNYVVLNPHWNDNRGAVTWGNGSTGVSGTISTANSLVGSNPNDYVGGDPYSGNFIFSLSNGNYVVGSSYWNNNRGAVTWANGDKGMTGTVSQANSLVGSDPGDQVGYFGNFTSSSFLVDSPHWNGDRGAVTRADGTTGISGTVSIANSLVGSNPGDSVGFNKLSFPKRLTNGNYVVESQNWDGNRGAVTLVNMGISGPVSATNSVVGSSPGDEVGFTGSDRLPWVTPLTNGDYVINSPSWGNSRGAITWVSGITGRTLDGQGIITPQNSLLGQAAGVLDNPSQHSFVAVSRGRVTVGVPDPNQFSYARAQAQTMNLTPQFLTGTLNTGAAVVLQASNDITVNSPITVSAGGHGGPLTLQAGRSILVKAPIATDNGALTLIANDQSAKGVVDSQRDAGNAVITIAPGTILDTGSGSLTVELRDGAGLTNRNSGAITLQTVKASFVSAVNNGPSAGSDIIVGPVSSSRSQTYTDPHGSTTVAGNLTAADSSITFSDSVIVKDQVTVSAGANAIYFAGTGTQMLESGAGSSFGNINHTATGTLRLQSGLTDNGSFVNGFGIFDANNQPVTVSEQATVLGGTYLAGTAPQTFLTGLAITNGLFASSTGPMTVTGGVRLLGGTLSGVGSVDHLTAISGTVVPGGDRPGVLTASGAVSLNGPTMLSIIVNGPDAGTGYSQLAIAGSIDLGGSTLSLNLGFTPPVGSSFEILTNTGAMPISGTFQGLDDGTVFTQDSYQFQITYRGGVSGNGVVVTRMA
jgi:hypothetical protein